MKKYKKYSDRKKCLPVSIVRLCMGVLEREREREREKKKKKKTPFRPTLFKGNLCNSLFYKFYLQR